MMTHRLLTLLFCLVAGFATAQAQSTLALNTVSEASKPGTSGKSPRQTKAAESPLYVKIYGYYSLLTPGGELNYSLSQAQSTVPTMFNPTDKSLGAGLRAGIGLGYIVSDFINLGIDADILLGTDLKTENNFYSGTNKYNTTITTTLKVLSIIPNITFKALSRPSYYIYNRLGLAVGVVLDYKTTAISTITPTKGAITTSTYTNEYTKNSLALGYQAALGIQFRLSQNLRGYAEVVAYNQSFKPQKLQSSYISITSGVSTTQSSATDYKNQGDYNKSNPSELPSYNVAINSVGVGAGLTLRF